MFKLVIQDDEGKTTVVPLIRDEITIGRKEGNTIRLTERNVSRRHARILRNNGEVQIEDLGSYNGIRVNNARIAERVSLRVSDQVQIGDYKLYLKAEGVEQVDDARTMPIERVDAAEVVNALANGTPGAQASSAPTTPIQVVSSMSAASSPALVGAPNRTQVALGDAAELRAAIGGVGPATQQAVAALSAPTGYGRLVVLSSNFAGKEFELSRPQMIIGRTEENDIVVNHRSISRNHAKVVREPDTGRYTVSDLQSSNGVRVNGQDYGKVELRRGDVVDLGHVRLRFVEPGEDFVFARDAVITDVPDAGGKRGMMIAIVLGVVVLGGIGAYVMTRGGGDKKPDGPNKGSNGDHMVVNGSNGNGSSGDVAVVTPGSNGSSGSPVGSDGSAGSMVAPSPIAIDAGASMVTNTGDAAARKRAECKQLQTDQKWQDLLNCAGDLDKIGDPLAGDLKDRAKAETANDLTNGKFRAAVAQKNWADVHKFFDEIGDDSVYKKDARGKYDAAIKAATDDARATAKSIAARHACKDMDALIKKAFMISPEAGDAVRQVHCDATATAPDHPDVPSHPDHPVTPHPDHPDHPVTPPPSTCDAPALAQKGKDEINVGQYAAALVSLEQSLRCQADPSLYRLILLAACNSANAGKAKQYFAKLPTSQQSSASQMCIRNKIMLP